MKFVLHIKKFVASSYFGSYAIDKKESDFFITAVDLNVLLSKYVYVSLPSASPVCGGT